MVLRYQPIESALTRREAPCRDDGAVRELLRDGADFRDGRDDTVPPLVMLALTLAAAVLRDPGSRILPDVVPVRDPAD
jgi:hypothetical protein